MRPKYKIFCNSLSGTIFFCSIPDDKQSSEESVSVSVSFGCGVAVSVNHSTTNWVIVTHLRLIDGSDDE